MMSKSTKRKRSCMMQRRNFCKGIAAVTVSSTFGSNVVNTSDKKSTWEEEMKQRKIKFVDLFCGIGGFHQALSDLGCECVFASDIDASCRETYRRNYGLEPAGDITKIDAKDIPSHNILCGGFPCQAFSKAGKRLGFADATKGTLFFDIIRILKHHKPEYAILENVRNLASHDKGNTWRVIYEQLDAAGYNVLPQPIIFSPHYIGIPQHRERVFIMCLRKDLGKLPQFYFDREELPKCSIDDILLDEDSIPNIDHYRLGQDLVDLIDVWNEFIQGIKCDKLPGFPIWADCLCDFEKAKREVPVKWNVSSFDELPRWAQNFVEKNAGLWKKNKDFIDKWMPRAQACKLFFGAKAKLEWQAGQSGHPNIWDNILQIRPSGIRVKPGTYFPALVAITQTSIVGRRKRFLTPRECARLQSFPDTFKYDEREAQAYKQFGNGVNVEVVKLFARYLLGDEEVRKKFSLVNAKSPRVRTGRKVCDDPRQLQLL